MTERPLHIGVDGRELLGTPRGVGRFLKEVLAQWMVEPRHGHRFTVFAPDEPPEELRALAGPLSWRLERSLSPGTWWEQTALARSARAAQLDVLFAPAYTAPLRVQVPIVQVIHDVSYFAHPEWFSWREGLRRRWLTKASARRAAAIVTVSEFSAAEIVTHVGVARDRIHVVPHGSPVNAPAGSLTREPLVLYVGTMFNRRHIPELMHAFAGLSGVVPGARLELVGDNQLRPPIDLRVTAEQLGVAGRVSWRPWVDDAELEHLYSRASAFAFLSDYEGFGLTPLEAIAHGVPPVLLDTPVAREIYRDAALFVPANVGAIKAALETLLTDVETRNRLLECGRRLVGSYSWNRAAADILRIIEQAARR